MAITPGDIRARFQMAMDRLYELEFSDKEAFDVYNNQHKIGPKTMVTIGGKKMKAGDVDKEETKKLSGTADRIDKIEKQLDSIEDIDQRENAEKLLEVGDSYLYEGFQFAVKGADAEGIYVEISRTK